MNFVRTREIKIFIKYHFIVLELLYIPIFVEKNSAKRKKSFPTGAL